MANINTKRTKLKLAENKIVFPRRDLAELACNCGHKKFGVHVKPLGHGGALARDVVCLLCKAKYELRPDLTFERTGIHQPMEKVQ